MSGTPRVWFVTGASTGFGRLLTELALKNGEKVAATVRKPEVLSALVEQYTDQLLVLKLDVTNSKDVTASFEKAKERFGRIDVVFNNAGWSFVAEIEATDDETARQIFEINFWGAVNVAREAVACFREFNEPAGGKLLHMSSMFGVDVSPGAGWYSATKFAADAIVETLSREIDPAWGIKITILCPGWFKTELLTEKAPVLPVHPAYAENASLPSRIVREVFEPMRGGDTRYMGDASKLIKLIYELSHRDDLPLHIPFGDDAIGCFENRVKVLSEDLAKGRQWSKGLKYD